MAVQAGTPPCMLCFSPPGCHRFLSAVTRSKREEDSKDEQGSIAGATDTAGPAESAVAFCGDRGNGWDWKLMEMAAMKISSV